MERTLQETRRNLDLNRRLSSLEAQYHAVSLRARADGAVHLDAVDDLRTPLNALRVNVENVLRARTDAKPTPGSRDVTTGTEEGQGGDTVQRIEETFDYHDTLVRTMLDRQPSADAGSANLHVPSETYHFRTTATDDRRSRETIGLVRVLERVREMFEGDAMAKGLLLTLRVEENGEASGLAATGGEPEAVLGPPLDLLRVVSSLVSNAIRFTNDGVVEIAVRADGDDWVVGVTDDGPGLSLDQLEEVRERYARLDPATTEGHGLGLAIVDRIAAQNGWSLVSVPRPYGTHLELRMPREPSDERAPERMVELT